jgi:hypothetical protein
MEYKTFIILIVLGLEISYKQEMIYNNCYPILEELLGAGSSYLGANCPKIVGRYLSPLESSFYLSDLLL